ncbi:putative membrane protein [Pseudomonas cerasi]|uniref:Putative membrane protein n=2 Tax=Pseudomonas cerasi TaxID=1583341 RepID=A0A193STJ1_9PSED|nr:putative membrane protein [Pseudomonas cerasi]SOS22394.1 putative membrane protein [Pseudomonas cerasi]
MQQCRTINPGTVIQRAWLSGMASFIEDLSMKAFPLLATAAVLILCVAGCTSGVEKSRMPKPVHITVQVVDENDQPLANTVVRVQQSAPAGDRFFCLNIALYGGRGCGTFKEWSLFEGDYPASGSLDITIEYFGGLNVQVVEPCDNTDPKAMRRYSLLSLATTGLIDGQQFKVKPVDSHLTGHSVEYGPCTTRLPSVESFDKQF